MTSSGRRKKHGLPTEKSTGRGTAPTVPKNMGYRRKKHHRRRKHTLPMQKTWPAVAKNMPSHQDRRKKHPPPLQKTPPTATVAKNTKTSHRRKKHELPTQKTRNPKLGRVTLSKCFCCLDEGGSSFWQKGTFVAEDIHQKFSGQPPPCEPCDGFQTPTMRPLAANPSSCTVLDAGNWLHLIIACQRGGNFLWHLLDAFLDWARAHGDVTSGDDWTTSGKRFTKQIRWCKGGKLLDVILYFPHPIPCCTDRH